MSFGSFENIKYISVNLIWCKQSCVLHPHICPEAFCSLYNTYFMLELSMFWSKHEVWLTVCVAAGSLYVIYLFSAGCSPCENMWSLLDQRRWSSVASIIFFWRAAGRGITAWQLRVKYFSTTRPLFFTSGSTDVSLVPWPFTFCACWVKKKRGGGGVI